MSRIATYDIHPDSPHYGHLIVYGEYGWVYRDVVRVRPEEDELYVEYEEEMSDATIVDSMLLCRTCGGREVSADDLVPTTEFWYGEFAEEE